MFGTDERGQAIQVGAVILFSFVVIGLSAYQATVVPNQNAQVEFDHNRDVQQDMIGLRTTVIGASYPGRNGVTSVTLGTSYPARTVAINPGPPSGTLRTRLNAKISIDSDGSTFRNDKSVCGTSPDNDITRTLVYEPNYNEFNGPQTIYENSVVYNNDTRNDGEAVLTRQALYYDTGSNDGTINLIALQNEYQQSSSQSASLEFIHGETKRTASVKNPEITLPTLVNDPTTWKQGILGDVPPSVIDSVTLNAASDEVKITFTGTFDILCTPVGVGGAPPTGATSLAPPRGASLPSDAVAYDDANENEEYDSGEETYKDGDFDGGDLDLSGEDVDLVIAKDVTRDSGDGLEIKASTIKVDSGVTVRSGKEQVKLLAENGEIRIQDANIEGKGLILKAATNTARTGDIQADDARLGTRSSKEIKVTANNGGTFFVNENDGNEANGGTYIIDTNNGNGVKAKLQAGNKDSGPPEEGGVKNNSTPAELSVDTPLYKPSDDLI